MPENPRSADLAPLLQLPLSRFRLRSTMWQTNTPWFDVAVTATVFMVGQLCFGRFVEYQSRWRRLLKSGVGIALIVATSVSAGRPWLYVLLGVVVVGVGIVHAWWLPRRGVNGWTAEPRDHYYALLGLDSAGKPLDPAGGQGGRQGGEPT